jgi:PAS domain S-box-containing protein
MRRGLLDPASLQHLLYQALDESDNILLVLERSGDDPAGLIVAATNGAFCRLSGFSSAELVGRPFLDLAAPDADPAIGAAMLQSAREQRSYRSELLCSRRSGAPFWLGLHLMPVRQTSPPFCVLLGRDITETLRDRRQHEAIQGLLAKVFVSVHAAVAILDEHGVIMMTNPALDTLLGYRSGGLVGKIGMDLNAPDARARAVAARQQQLDTGQNYTHETALVRADGSQVQVQFTSTVVERDDLKRFRIVTLFPSLP